MVCPCRFLALTLACACAQPVFAGPLIGARNLALSPDGNRIAFSCQGDIWIAPTVGGRAIPVTTHIEMDDYPVWSPDGKMIAFCSNRSGNNDIYVLPAEGGTPKRITWHSGNDIPSDWTPDGKAVLFATTRDGAENAVYSAEVETGRTRFWFADRVTLRRPQTSSDGKVLYQRFEFNPYRPRYHGSAAAQIWMFDPASQKRTLIISNEFQHLWSRFGPGGKIFTIAPTDVTPSSHKLGDKLEKWTDTPARTPNVCEISLDGKTKRITDFVEGSVRYLTVARDSGLLAFEHDGTLYSMKLGDKPKEVTLTASIDDKTTYEQRQVQTTGATGMALSPKGDAFVYTLAYDLWLISTKKGKGPNADDARQLTTWEGLDADPIWHPNGSTVYFASDRDGNHRLYMMSAESANTLPFTNAGEDVYGARLTPDQKGISYWKSGLDGGLFVANLEGTSHTRVLSRPGQNDDLDYAWSPDMRYVAYTEPLSRSGYFFWDSGVNILVFDTQTKTTTNVTKLNAIHTLPQFSPDGKYLFFRSNRAGDGIYALPLKREDARDTELELKFEKPTGPVKTEIDFDDIDLRARRIIAQVPTSSLKFDPGTGEVFFVSEGDIWKADYNGENARRITGGGGIASFEFAADYNSLAFVRSGTLNTLNLRGPNFPITLTTFRSEWIQDLRKVRHAAFAQFYNTYLHGFYDPNMHGRKWERIRARYEPLLDSIGHRNEMATILNQMVGELESSHSEVSPAPGNPSGSASSHPGFTIDYSYGGPGIRIKDVPARAPGSYAKTKLNPGEYVMTINGKEVSANEQLWRDVLNDQAGRDFTFVVNSKPETAGARTVKYRAVSDWGQIIYLNRIDARRKYVEDKSKGKLTYVHIAGMGGGNFDLFMRQFWQLVEGKKGVIVDVRDNGGGNISDRLIDMIERIPHSYYQDRDREALLAPGQTWAMPTVVMHAESSFSNAEMFPYAMKSRHLATLVGMPTPGYVIWTSGFDLVDGTGCRMPGSGVYRLDGTPLENMGQQPDVKVDWPVEDYLAGRDPQLDKAIEVLLDKLKQ